MPKLPSPISYILIFTHKRADRELIKPSCPPHRALHAYLAYLPHNHRRRRDRTGGSFHHIGRFTTPGCRLDDRRAASKGEKWRFSYRLLS
jgi:hypothetical protein